MAPSGDAVLYRRRGGNGGRHATGVTPEPTRNPYSDEAIEARYHTNVVAVVGLERRRSAPARGAEDLEVARGGALAPRGSAPWTPFWTRSGGGGATAHGVHTRDIGGAKRPLQANSSVQNAAV